jgi:hypothetical protein
LAAKLGNANSDAGIVEDQAEHVVYELALKPESRSCVLVVLVVPVILQADVPLLESLDAEIESADVCGGRVRFLADLEPEAMGGKRVGKGGRFEIHVQAAVEVGSCRAVYQPATGSIGF